MTALKMLATWPVPALLAWIVSWCVFVAAQRWMALSPVPALLLASALALALGLRERRRWRRIVIVGGFVLSLGASQGMSAWPAWVWLIALALLALLYPLRSWRDAPLFPTPAGALAGLAKLAVLPPHACIVDAGCGLGAGLRELRREYPQARLYGLEWSWPLRLACAWRVRFATVRRADIWAADWSGFDLVYLFQRPESMPRAAHKALRELHRGAWMASLEFEVPELLPDKTLACADGRRVWLYRAPFRRRPESGHPDKRPVQLT